MMNLVRQHPVASVLAVLVLGPPVVSYFKGKIAELMAPPPKPKPTLRYRKNVSWNI